MLLSTVEMGFYSSIYFVTTFYHSIYSPAQLPISSCIHFHLGRYSYLFSFFLLFFLFSFQFSDYKKGVYLVINRSNSTAWRGNEPNDCYGILLPTPKGKIAVVLILPDKVCRTFYPKYPRNSIEIVVRAFYLLFVLHARKMTLRGVFQKGNIFPRPAVLKEEKEERKF